MIDLRPEDLLHKSHLNRFLMEVIDCPPLAQNLAFKGGSCAAMLGYLDRFSVDLDFDLLNQPDEGLMRKEFHRIFEQLGLEVAGEFDRVLFFQLKYPSVSGKRNSLKVSCNSQVVRANEYKAQYLPEIDRMMTCQTLETMVANKLVAITDRYDQHRTVAGRDIYDIHYFLVHGYSYEEEVVRERTGLEPKAYLEKLVSFIRKHVTQTIVNEDLNTLLPPRNFQQIRKVLIPETIVLLIELSRRD
jgi:predicted nucleotidyltransferase component of viral defense system